MVAISKPLEQEHEHEPRQTLQDEIPAQPPEVREAGRSQLSLSQVEQLPQFS